MIATTDYPDYWYTITATYPTGGNYNPNDYNDFIESDNQRSLRLLREQLFIPRKIGLEAGLKIKKNRINIRNQLPYKLRYD